MLGYHHESATAVQSISAKAQSYCDEEAAFDLAPADSKTRPILTALIFVLECVNGVNIRSVGASMNNLATNRSRTYRLWRAGICFGIASWMSSIGVAADASGAATLVVHFIGLKSSQGSVMVALYNSEDAYENSGTASEAATRTIKLEIKDETASATLAGIPPGQYAIKAFHDLNGDAKLNTNLFGIPTEPVAFSNDAPVHMHAPSWKETVFTVQAGDNVISIHID
jgi:uncharacterized protein (DUF2141 family)